MSALSQDERASAFDLHGEAFVFPGGQEYTGRFVDPPDERLGAKVTIPSVRFVYEDARYTKVGDKIVRASNGHRYYVRDMDDDGFHGYRTLTLESRD